MTSSGYGTSTPPKKDFSDKEEKLPFKPDLSITAKQRKTATASGYGKVVAAKKPVDLSKYTPEFKPKLDEVGGKSGAKLRATTEARFLAQSQRPQTAPELRPKPTLKFTLAADHSPKQTPAEQAFEGKAFVLDGSMLGMLPPTLSKSSIDFFPPPVTPTAAGQKLKESATSTGCVGALARVH